MDVVLLDTDVFSYLLKGNDPKGEPYKADIQAKRIAISFVTVGELYFGAYKRKWGDKRLIELEARLKAVLIVPYDLEICKTYAQIRNEVKTASGSDRLISANDLWIAACAIRHALTLITNNRKHFDGIPRLTLISHVPLAKPPVRIEPGLFNKE